MPGPEAAERVEAVVAGRMRAGEQQRVDLGDAGGDRQPRAVVDVARAQQRVGLAVVGAERRQLGAVLQHVRDQRLEVLAGRALTDEDPHALAPPLDHLLERRRLVVGLDAGGQVGVEVATEDAGAVAVDPAPAGGSDAREHLRVACDHAGEVHDLRHSARPVLLDQLADVVRGERRAGALERGGRDAARGVDPERERQRRGRLGQRHDARNAEHVRDLVGVGGHGRGAVRKHRADELVDPELRRLEVHVGVDERGRERAAADVQDLVRVALAPARPPRRRRARARCRPTRAGPG